jgi:pSer/pThr/pTyr-binding forkhead associated (FHA) protein
MHTCRQCGQPLEREAQACPACQASAHQDDAVPSLGQIPSISLPDELEIIVSSQAPARPPGQDIPRLLVVRGGTQGREFPIRGEEALIGRWDPECGSHPQVDLSDEDTEAKISRKHALLSRKGGQFFLEDLGSRNGTFINRQTRITPHVPHPIKDGDEILIGKLSFRFLVGVAERTIQ